MSRSFIIALGLGLCTGTVGSRALADSNDSPWALAPGQTNSISFRGVSASDEATVWTSFAATIQSARAESASAKAFFPIVLDRSTPPGIGAVQCAGTNGFAHSQLVLIDPLPGVAASGTNLTAATAQLVHPPVAIDGACPDLASHFYRLPMRRRQSVTLEVVANRLGSPLAPFLRVLDARGRELANAHDTPGCAADARIEFVAPANGDYFIELRDTRYEGGTDHRYRLRAGDPLPVPLPFLPLARPAPGPVAELPRYAEHEPNDSATNANRVQLPVLITGRFDRLHDRDFFAFAAAKDGRLAVKGRTRSLGSPGDLYLRLEKPDGTRLAEADVAGADEGSLTHKFAAGGEYRLVVEELTRGGGARFNYELEITSPTPGFTLSVSTNTVATAPGGSFEMTATCVRRDFDGPITLALAGLDAGFTLTNQVIAEKQTSATVSVTVPAHWRPGELRHFAVTGTGQIGETQLETRATTLPALKAQFPALLHPPRELDGLLTLLLEPANQPAK